jgi:hypothetical protein
LILKENLTYNYTFAVTLVVSIVSALLCFHPDIHYNSDLKISSVGLVIADTIAENPYSLHHLLPGFKANGGFTKYLNWPPFFYWLLALWFKLGINSILSARIFMVLIKIGTDILFLHYLSKLKIEPKQSLLLAIIFCLIPFRLTYLDLIFGDSLVFLLVFATLYFDTQKQYTKLAIVAMLGTLTSWYFIVFVGGYIAVQLFQKNQLKTSLILLSAAFFTISAWLLYIYFMTINHTIALGPKPLSTPRLNQISFFNQGLSYSWLYLLNGYSGLVVTLKWVIKLGIETLALTLVFCSVKAESRQKLLHHLLPFIIGFALLLLFLPNLFLVHNHNIYFISFGLALYLSTKIKPNLPWYTMLLLPMVYGGILYKEHTYHETQLRDHFILAQLQKSHCTNLFINNPAHQLIDEQFMCTPWYLMYKSKAMVFERLGDQEYKAAFIAAQLAKTKDKNYVIVSTVAIEELAPLEKYSNGLYSYSSK